MRILLQYCESDRGKEQLELLESFSTFEVVSSHLVVNAGIRLGSQLKYNMHSSTSHSANVGTVDRDYQVDDTYESSPRKRTRNEGDDYRGISCVFFIPRCKMCVVLADRTNEDLFWFPRFTPYMFSCVYRCSSCWDTRPIVRV